MKITYLMLICLLIILSDTTGYVLNETIHLKGNEGTMLTSSDIGYAYDLVQGSGIQEYSRTIEYGNITMLKSHYKTSFDNKSSASDTGIYSNYNKNRSNSDAKYTDPILLSGQSIEQVISDINKRNCRYSMGINSQKGQLSHVVSISKISSINTSNTITESNMRLDTNYSIEGEGTLSETVIDKGRTHPTPVTSTWINANFSMSSALGSEIKKPVSDEEILMSKINETLGSKSANPADAGSITNDVHSSENIVEGIPELNTSAMRTRFNKPNQPQIENASPKHVRSTSPQ